LAAFDASGPLIIWTYFGTFNFREIFSQIRAPKTDAHGEMKYEQIDRAKDIRASPGDKTDYGWRPMNPSPTGDSAVLFPRDQTGHFDGPMKSIVFTINRVRRSTVTFPIGCSSSPGWRLPRLHRQIGSSSAAASLAPRRDGRSNSVSALIHAATMVAAGVYLVGRSIRCSRRKCCWRFPTSRDHALRRRIHCGRDDDIKKVLAYSTVSQLGYMMLALGIGGWTAGLLHLLTHAFFKALLFLGSGSVIYGCHHQQDMLKMGGLYPK